MHDSATSTDAGIAANSGVSSAAACQSPSPSTPASTMLAFGSASPATPTTRTTRVTTTTSASTPPHRSPPHHHQQQHQQEYHGSRPAASATEYRLPTAATISLAPTMTTTVVTTTTTTTTHFPPLILKPPPLPRDLDPKEYPLADTPTPPALKRFCFDMNGQPTFFREDEDADKAISKLQETMYNMRRTGPTSTRTVKSMNGVNSMQSQSSVFSQEAGIGSSRKRPASPAELPYEFLPSQQNGNGPGFEERTPRTIRSISPPPKRARAKSGSTGQEQDDEQRSQMAWTELKNELRPVLEAAASNRPAMSPASVLAETSTSPTIMQPTPVSSAARHYGTISTNNLGMDTPSTTRSTHSSALPSPSLSPVTGVSASAGGNQFDSFFGDHANRNDMETEESALENAPLQENQDGWIVDATAASEPPHVPSLLDLPTMLSTFDALPATMQSYMIFHMLRRCPTNTLQYVSNIILPALRKDFLGQLPLELGLHVVRYLDAPSMCRAARVSKKWRDVLDSDGPTWRRRLLADGYILEEGEERKAEKENWSLFDSMEPARRRAASVDANLDSSSEMETVIEFDGEETENAQPNSTPVLEVDMTETAAQGDNDDNSCNDDECVQGVTGYPMHLRDIRPRSSQRKKRPSGGSQRKRRRTTYEVDRFYDGDDDSEFEDIGSQYVTKKHDLPLSPAKHPYKAIYRKHHLMRQNWHHGRHKHISFAGHGNNVVTCLQFDSSKIISGSDDQCINVYDTSTGELRKRLGGHEGGVWALQYVGNTLVSGSTDRTVRIWDIEKGECTHVFHGHTSTVRCLQIIMPQLVDANSDVMKPERPLIITGSRDSTLRVWHLPKLGEEENWRPDDESGDPGIPFEERHIPWFVRTLTGHTHSVRALAGAGNTLVSGSYDCNVRVWNIETGECFWRLQGHTQKVYSVVLDTKRNRCMSGSMDGTVKVWSLEDGTCLWTLEGHSSLVGLLDLSHDHLVSAAADSSLRIWNPNDGTCKHVLTAHTGAITCFQHDENKVISGSDGTLKMWDVRTGQFIRDLLTGLSGVWQVRFDERRCVAAVQRNQVTWFEVLDFGVYGIEDDDDIKDNNGNWVPRRKIVGANSANNS